NITRDAAIKGIVESPGNTKSWAEVEKAYDDAMQLHGIVSIIAGYKVAGDEAAQGGKGSVKPEAAKGTTAGNKISYVEEPPFNPAGTGGAAQPWSTKGRIKYVELPTSGKIRYVPPEDYSASQPLPRGPNNGYFDKFGNEWVKGPSRTAGQAFEWDVQLSRTGKAQLGWATRDGSHLNISLDGKITHK
uniref:polymorphic toxin type 17 domain-containing protein n=2 Tax=Buttiauxella TaxID=82976 RepID=UPI001EDC3333